MRKSRGRTRTSERTSEKHWVRVHIWSMLRVRENASAYNSTVLYGLVRSYLCWAHEIICIRIFTFICFISLFSSYMYMCMRFDGWTIARLVGCCYCFYFVFAAVIVASRFFDAVQKSKCTLSETQSTICQQCHSHCVLLNSRIRHYSFSFRYFSSVVFCWCWCCCCCCCISCCRYRLSTLPLPIIFLCVFYNHSTLSAAMG